MVNGLRKLEENEINDIKEKIKIAKKIVSGEEEPFKTEAFKIIFGRLMGVSLEQEIEEPEEIIKEKSAIDKKKNELAKNCGITKEELEEVFSIKEDVIKIIVPIMGNESFKRSIAAQCYLIASEIILNKEWVESKELAETMREIGVKDLSNLSPQLKKNSEIFRIDAKQGNNKYKLTSNIGRNSAFKIIKKLAKGDDLIEN